MMKKLCMITVTALGAFLLCDLGQAYPIDGYKYTGISRLDFYDLAQQGVVSGRQLPAGGKLPLATIHPRYPKLNSIDSVQLDEQYAQQITTFLGEQTDNYGVALLDLSNPDQPIYAEHNPDYKSNVGSVGKLIVGIGLFTVLAELYPEIADRENLLRTAKVTADRFIENDHHKVPIWDVENRSLQHRALKIGDEATLWEYVDWMLSASSNAAASMVMREILLLRHFGHEYPASPQRTQEYLEKVSSTQIRDVILPALATPLQNHGLDTDQLRQGSFFSRYGKNRMGGTSSFGTPRELMKLLLLMERGELVDEFTSRELKRMLYMTQRRIRYISHPALSDSAAYFKSGSLYSCVPEEGFVCRKYQGNKRNTLASVAIIETEKEGRNLHYMAVVISNVLRVNSAVAHQTLALRIHRMIEQRQQQSDTTQ